MSGVQTKALILKYMPDFCWISMMDLYLMLEQVDENIDWLSFQVTFYGMRAANCFKSKPSPYHEPPEFSSPTRRANIRSKTLYLRISSQNQSAEKDAA